MRTPRTLARAGLPVAALLVLTACGGSDDEAPDATATSSAAASTTAGSSAAESSEPAAGDSEAQTFCTEAEQAFAQITNGLDAADPSSLGAALDESVAVFDRIEAPAEIAPDWDAMQQAFTGLRDAVAEVDLNTPEGQTAVQQAVTDLETSTADPQVRVQQYCDNA